MSLKHKITGGLLVFFGMLFFGFGLYILPFGTDAYMYFWINIIYKGDWLKGDIMANAFALAMIAVGAIMLWKAGRAPIPKELEALKKEKERKKKARKKRSEKKWLRL